jgi:hypothetical protein
VEQQANSGPGLFIVEVYRSRTSNWTRLNERSARRRGRYLHNTQQTQEMNIHAFAGFEPAIPAIKRLQTYALDRTAPRIGLVYVYMSLYYSQFRLHKLLVFTVISKRRLGIETRWRSWGMDEITYRQNRWFVEFTQLFITQWTRAVIQAVLIFCAFCGNRRFVAMFTIFRHVSQSWTNLMQCAPSYPLFL